VAEAVSACTYWLIHITAALVLVTVGHCGMLRESPLIPSMVFYALGITVGARLWRKPKAGT